MNKYQAILPDAPGHYIWYNIDLQSIDIGLVQVIKDDEKHIDLLIKSYDPLNCIGHYLYRNSKNELLTMYDCSHKGDKVIVIKGQLCGIEGFIEVNCFWDIISINSKCREGIIKSLGERIVGCRGN